MATTFAPTTTGGPCVEQWGSRTLEITTDGESGQRIWHCEQPISNPNSPVDLYDSWPTGHASLKVRRIRFERHEKDGTMVTAEYATEKNTSLTVQEWDMSGQTETIQYDRSGKRIQGGAQVLKPGAIYRIRQYLGAFPTAQVIPLTGKRNNAAWGAYAEGTFLFLGAQGTRSGLGTWETTYSFQYDPEFWFHEVQNDADGTTVTHPIYDEGDFTTLPGVIAPS